MAWHVGLTVCMYVCDRSEADIGPHTSTYPFHQSPFCGPLDCSTHSSYSILQMPEGWHVCMYVCMLGYHSLTVVPPLGCSHGSSEVRHDSATAYTTPLRNALYICMNVCMYVCMYGCM